MSQCIQVDFFTNDGVCPCGGNDGIILGFRFSSLFGLEAIEVNVNKYPLMGTTDRMFVGDTNPIMIRIDAMMNGRFFMGLVESSSFDDDNNDDGDDNNDGDDDGEVVNSLSL